MSLKNKNEADSKSCRNLYKIPLQFNNLYKLSIYILQQNRYKINYITECW